MSFYDDDDDDDDVALRMADDPWYYRGLDGRHALKIQHYKSLSHYDVHRQTAKLRRLGWYRHRPAARARPNKRAHLINMNMPDASLFAMPTKKGSDRYLRIDV